MIHLQHWSQPLQLLFVFVLFLSEIHYLYMFKVIQFATQLQVQREEKPTKKKKQGEINYAVLRKKKTPHNSRNQLVLLLLSPGK